MLKRFVENLKSRALVEKGDTVVLGVSGGPDSLCMLSLFLQIKDAWELTLLPVHLNHGIRGEAARRDAEKVAEYCRQNRLEGLFFERDVAALAESQGLSLEEAGRNERRKLLQEAARRVGARRIALGQNKNDQAETILMRLMRGTGLEGLAGIAHEREGLWIRPILIFTRREIEAYCMEKNLAPCIDQTNLEPLYTRNKIRLELIPYMEKAFNPDVVGALCRMGELAGIDHACLDALAEAAFEEMIRETDGNMVRIDRAAYSRRPEALRTRILRKALERSGSGLKDISRERLGAADGLADARGGEKRIQFPGGVEVRTTPDSLLIGKAALFEPMPPFERRLPMGGACEVPEAAVRIETVLLPAGQASLESDGPWCVHVDRDKIEASSLTVRNRRKGDRFMPLGMKGSKKLKDFLIDEKVDPLCRDRVVLVCDGSRILWVSGHRPSEAFKVDTCTKSVLEIRMERGCS